MRTINRGLLWLLTNSVFYALASLGFVRSGLNTSLLTTWFGLLGSITAIGILFTENNFRIIQHGKDKRLYFCFLNTFIFGGSAFGCHFLSLRYILPSDSMLINAFFCLCSSVVAETVRERKCPTLLSVASVLSGVIGTGLICNPQALFSLDILQMKSLLGVSLALFSGIFFVLMISRIRNFSQFPVSWYFLGYMTGSTVAGLFTYRPFSEVILCALHLKLIALAAIFCQIFAAFSIVRGTSDVTVSGTFVIQTSSSVFTFIAQIILFPGRITILATLGTGFIVASVLTQVGVLMLRDQKMRQMSIEQIQN